MRLTVDFNAIHGDGEVVTRLEVAPKGLSVGDRVVLDDGEGEACEGTVSRITDRLVYAEMDWGTWGSPESEGDR